MSIWNLLSFRPNTSLHSLIRSSKEKRYSQPFVANPLHLSLRSCLGVLCFVLWSCSHSKAVAYDLAWTSRERECSSCEREGNKLITSVLLSHFRPHQFSIIPVYKLKIFKLNPLYLFCVHWTHGGHLDVPPGIWVHHFKDQVPTTIEHEVNLAVLAFPIAPAVRKGEMHGVQSCYVINVPAVTKHQCKI